MACFIVAMGALEWLVGQMFFEMNVERGLAIGFVVAVRTRIRFFPGMLVLMFFQMMWMLESSIALVTFERTFTGVSS